VRLKYGVIVECTGCEKDADGNVTAVLATVVPDTKSGTPGADLVKVKGKITWVSEHAGVHVTFNLYDRLFAVPQPGSADSLTAELNPNSMRVTQGYVEPSAGNLAAET